MDLNINDLKQLIGREINSCLQPGGGGGVRHPSDHQLSNKQPAAAADHQPLQSRLASPAEQLPKLSSDVTLTKVAAPERLPEREKETSKVNKLLLLISHDTYRYVVLYCIDDDDLSVKKVEI